MKSQEADLKSVKQQFASWRRKKRSLKSKSIPEELWVAATQLCSRYPVSRIRNELVLDYHQLKSRLESGDRKRQSESFAVIELPAPIVQEQASFEWVRTDGARLRIKLAASSADRVVADFLGDQR